MSLMHELSIIAQNNKEIFNSSEMYKVYIPDELILYINDNLNWINSIWNGVETKRGISYHGFSIIENTEIKKLMNILMKMKEMFEYAPDKFYLTGEFSLDEMKYQKIEFERKEFVNCLVLLIDLCRKALEENANILHLGI